jgi:hypothetical protein
MRYQVIPDKHLSGRFRVLLQSCQQNGSKNSLDSSFDASSKPCQMPPSGQWENISVSMYSLRVSFDLLRDGANADM